MTQILSHQTSQFNDPVTTSALVQKIEERLKKTERLMLPLDRTLELLHQLKEFELGRFLLHNRGLNGYWTSYIFQHGFGKSPETALESWLLGKSLLVQARERFHRFKQELGQHVREGVHLASIPSGLMDDLLQLDYRGLQHFQLTGIDVDAQSLDFARRNAQERRLEAHCQFLQRDAWHLDIQDTFDAISSNGLNMYEPDPRRLVSLYRNFHDALKRGGYLLMSFLPPPPAGDPASGAWEAYETAPEDLLIERALFGDIIQANYLNFATEQDTRAQLEEAGLTVERINYSRKGVLPIVVARK
ncbi:MULTISPECIES: class I SAM-dependent methyltransferase [Myxococcus]|uniref:Methyltransferase domain-containing protein n=1 Tax=Myxococcus xanthus TaxID=34 RepID=A0A7Y4IHL2_MYXXA|nr:class I SAM-dependent methyltransferase [Myxococcus xanthus]NOJ79236.1 methyltransferase domain-containing protein [Myxococcus xanthus]NOJ91039.1 methyltransferase domain-containing protein [Myxococcus xanthus]